MAEDRCDVPVGEEHHRDDENRRRETGRRDERPRPERLHDRENSADEDRPAKRVMEERGAREGAEYTVHAERLDGDFWEVKATAL